MIKIHVRGTDVGINTQTSGRKKQGYTNGTKTLGTNETRKLRMHVGLNDREFGGMADATRVATADATVDATVDATRISSGKLL